MHLIEIFTFFSKNWKRIANDISQSSFVCSKTQLTCSLQVLAPKLFCLLFVCNAYTNEEINFSLRNSIVFSCSLANGSSFCACIFLRSFREWWRNLRVDEHKLFEDNTNSMKNCTSATLVGTWILQKALAVWSETSRFPSLTTWAT